MKALTLTQPWATLVAVGAKSIETRSWSTPYRGVLAIHAAKGLAGMTKDGLADVCDSDPFFRVLRPYLSGYTATERAAALPRGAFVAVARVAHVLPTEGLAPALATLGYNAPFILSTDELAFGDYTLGRYAWVLEDVQSLGDPIPCSGALGLWDVPAAAEATLRESFDFDRGTPFDFDRGTLSA